MEGNTTTTDITTTQIDTSNLTVTTNGDNFRTVQPENGTEYLVSSGIDIIFLVVILIIILILSKLKDLGKLGINKLKLFIFLKDSTEGLREEAKEEAIKTLREKDIKITGTHHMSKETIQKYEKEAKDLIEDIAKKELKD